MKKNLFFVFFILTIISGCANTNPNLYKNYCQKDYWGDTKFDIFGRKNCIGDAGRWFDEANGRSGYYCMNPSCSQHDVITCKDTCSLN